MPASRRALRRLLQFQSMEEHHDAEDDARAALRRRASCRARCRSRPPRRSGRSPRRTTRPPSSTAKASVHTGSPTTRSSTASRRSATTGSPRRRRGRPIPGRAAADPIPKGKSAEGVDANASKKHSMEVARRLDISGRSTMSKDELVSAIKKANRRVDGPQSLALIASPGARPKLSSSIRLVLAAASACAPCGG